jgi:hypothetical protein
MNNNNILLSNSFVLPCYTNQEKREVPLENHAQISTQEIEHHEQTQEEDDSSEEIQEEEPYVCQVITYGSCLFKILCWCMHKLTNLTYG